MLNVSSVSRYMLTIAITPTKECALYRVFDIDGDTPYPPCNSIYDKLRMMKLVVFVSVIAVMLIIWFWMRSRLRPPFSASTSWKRYGNRHFSRIDEGVDETDNLPEDPAQALCQMKQQADRIKSPDAHSPC